MQCLHPLLAYMPYKSKKIEFIGDYQGNLLLNRVTDKNGKFLQIPCGHCINCRITRADDWKKRILKECEKYDNNHFITLTYDDCHLPDNNSLCKRDVQLFIKKLRKFLVTRGVFNKIKYFVTGEYGDISRRPHYHMILMNCDLSILNMKYIKNENDTNYYSSELISRCWTNHDKEKLGNNIVARVVKESVAYTTKYSLKKQYGPNSDIYNKLNIIPEFMLCSKGIGLDFLYNNIDKLSVCGNMLVSDGVHYANYESLPKYYRKKIKEYNIANYSKLVVKSAEIVENAKVDKLRISKKSFNKFNKDQEIYKNQIYKNKGKL